MYTTLRIERQFLAALNVLSTSSGSIHVKQTDSFGLMNPDTAWVHSRNEAHQLQLRVLSRHLTHHPP